MKECSANTLGFLVERFCIMQFNDKQKHFKNFLVMAVDVWEELFQRTLWCYQSKWVTPATSTGEPYPYITLPENISTFIDILEEVGCNGRNKLVPLERVNKYSVLPKPEQKKCGCKQAACDCGSACESAQNLTYEETEVTIDDEVYIEKKWLELCANGSVIEWREIPTKEYEPGTEDYEIVATTTQRTICQLEVKECGCVAETDENKKLLGTYCGCSYECNTGLPLRNYDRFHCETKFQFSDCGRKLYLIGAVKSEYQIKFQLAKASYDTLVPDYAKKALWAGIEDYSSAYNPSKHPREKDRARRIYEAEKIGVLEYLNPIDFDVFDRLNSEPIKW